MDEIKALFNLGGKTAVVTGGAGLLGCKFGEALASVGARVALIDVKDPRQNKAVTSLIKKYGDKVTTHICDITDEPRTQEMIESIAGDGNIDILINSAAVDPKFEIDSVKDGDKVGAFLDYSLENWKRSIDVNLTGTFIVTKASCAHMEKANSGVVVNISSTYGLTGPDQRIYESESARFKFLKPVDYSVTKAGILGFTRALATYYQGRGIRVNALTPGGTRNNNSEEFMEKYSYRTVIGRMAEADEYKGAIIFLCSAASSYMTGANLVVDGGWTAL